MREITALKRQKRNAERVNVFLDGEFAFGIGLNDALSLRVGDRLSAERVAELEALGTFDLAKENALRYLSYRPRSTAEIHRHLLKKGYDASVCDQVIARLTTLNLLDDAAFARYWIEQREQFKPRSPLLLQRELREKGIARVHIEAAMEDVDPLTSARKAAAARAARWEHLPREAFDKKLGGYLQRRGFRYDVIRTILDEFGPDV